MPQKPMDPLQQEMIRRAQAQTGQDELGTPNLPPSPLLRILELLEERDQHKNRIPSFPRWGSTSPWMVESDFRNPSADYLSKFTEGPLTNYDRDTSIIQKKWAADEVASDQIAGGAAKREAERKRLHGKKYELGK